MRYIEKYNKHNIIIMSAANSLAKKRRAPPLTPQQLQAEAASNQMNRGIGGTPVPTYSETPTSGFTLQQVIAVIDRRLSSLEKTTTELKNTTSISTPPPIQTQTPQQYTEELTEYLDEFNTRFEMLAEEIANLKTIVMNLQSYTMGVNKMLLEERSTLNNYTVGENNTFSMENIEEEATQESTDL